MEKFISGYTAGQKAQERRLQMQQNQALGDLAKQYMQDPNPQTLGQIATINPQVSQGLMNVQKQAIQQKAKGMIGIAKTYNSASPTQRQVLYPKLIKQAEEMGLDVSQMPLEQTRDNANEIGSYFNIAENKAGAMLGIKPTQRRIEQDITDRKRYVDTGEYVFKDAKAQPMGKAPSGYRYTQTGELEAIPGGPATKLSETGAKTLALTQQGAKSIDDLETTIQELGGTVTAKTAYSPNIFQEENQQRFNTLINDLSDTIGRLRSGGAINEGEETRFRKLLPKFGDKQGTINHKLNRLRENFSTVTKGIQRGKLTGTEKKAVDYSTMSEEDLFNGL
jgi:hypothetical protein